MVPVIGFRGTPHLRGLRWERAKKSAQNCALMTRGPATITVAATSVAHPPRFWSGGEYIPKPRQSSTLLNFSLQTSNDHSFKPISYFLVSSLSSLVA